MQNSGILLLADDGFQMPHSPPLASCDKKLLNFHIFPPSMFTRRASMACSHMATVSGTLLAEMASSRGRQYATQFSSSSRWTVRMGTELSWSTRSGIYWFLGATEAYGTNKIQQVEEISAPPMHITEASSEPNFCVKCYGTENTDFATWKHGPGKGSQTIHVVVQQEKSGTEGEV